MDTTLTAIEVTGIVDEHHQLKLDTELPITGPRRVRVILLYSPAETISEAEWLAAAARNPAFAYLKESREDVYSLNDGQPFHDQA